MAYQYPEHAQLILVYFRTEEPFDVTAYMPDDEARDYRTFQVPGAQGMEYIDDRPRYYGSHEGDNYPWTLCGALDLAANVNQILAAIHHAQSGYSSHGQSSAPTVEHLSDDMMAYLTGFEGIKVIPDICGRGEPMLLFGHDLFIRCLQSAAGPPPPWSERDEWQAWENRSKEALRRFSEKVSGQTLEQDTDKDVLS